MNDVNEPTLLIRRSREERRICSPFGIQTISALSVPYTPGRTDDLGVCLKRT